ncbi:MAG: uroporphyrinogen-III C-methyltransferase [Acidimicrobiales bacterium]|nr:uroporphyrinogen-III C-methyltransferase [Acidimicrobiales bacterium]
MTVYLVGAGPGDPDLLTLRAAKLLQRADVLVHDRLIDEHLFDLVAPWAELVDVGKRPGGPISAQDSINAVLVDRGSRYDTVVRLKGGDPYVFGRGGEEAEVLIDAGIDVEVVPGITSAIAAPAAAGIPVTMRHESSGFTVVTAHQDPANDRTLDWDALARLGTTLVVLMGASRAAAISERLRSGGMAPGTPVAVICGATHADQEVLRTDLAGLAELPVRSPATIVVGDVARRQVAAIRVAASADGVTRTGARTGARQGALP